MNWTDVCKVGTYEFRWTKDLQPIPVEVPIKVAEYLTSLEEGCKCRHRNLPKMFKIVG